MLFRNNNERTKSKKRSKALNKYDTSRINKIYVVKDNAVKAVFQFNPYDGKYIFADDDISDPGGYSGVPECKALKRFGLHEVSLSEAEEAYSFTGDENVKVVFKMFKSKDDGIVVVAILKQGELESLYQHLKTFNISVAIHKAVGTLAS